MFEEDRTIDQEVDETSQQLEQAAGGADSVPEPEEDPVEAAIERRLIRERAIQDRRLKRLFGTKNLDEAARLAEAGRAVSNAAGVTPQVVTDRVRQQYQQRPAQAGTPSDDIRRELSEIRELIATERDEKSRELQVTDARKEFGALYDRYQDDIEMTAEDRGLSLADAAAITLRPHLKTYYEQQAQARRQVASKRKVEGSGDPPAQGSTVDYDSALSSSQKMVAKRMGLTDKRYYEQLKELGRAPQ